MKTFFDTTKHKLWVFWYILKACLALLKRAIVHDLSKYSTHEASYFAKADLLKNLKDIEYGSEEYKQQIKELLGPALKHHYENNSHHPEHYCSIAEMSPLDMVEMLADWKAAGRRHKTGSMKNSFMVNGTRFNIPHELYIALKRDAIEMRLL